MTVFEIIDKKIRKVALSAAEIKYFVEGFCAGGILPEQAAAFCAAVCINGMTDEETAALTLAMRDSGGVLDLSGIDGVKADKHSTGGVGDTTTMIVVPVLACLGIKAAKMSGRSLGHTGGTIDKLESYPGYTAEQSEEDFIRIVRETGASIISQSMDIAPADKKLYALRDRTGTVNSIPLIASSVMSKKLALGADTIVLDVKYGSGAFMKNPGDAVRLGECMVNIGKACGKKTAAVITSMEQPLSYAAGCNLELNAAVEVLRGAENDLSAVSLKLCEITLGMNGLDTKGIGAVIKDGRALAKFEEIIRAHGGAFSEKLPASPYRTEVASGGDGYIGRMNTEEIGLITSLLGGGRMGGNTEIDHTVGVVMNKRLGDSVKRGEPIAFVYGKITQENLRKLAAAVTITKQKPQIPELIYKIIY